MAFVKFVNYKPADVYVQSGRVVEVPHRTGVKKNAADVTIQGFPQVCWSNGANWESANFWLVTFFPAVMRGAMSLDTLVGLAYCLLHYMNFLERESIHWLAFPLPNSKRCVFQYHLDLQANLKKGNLSFTSGKARLKAVIRFYTDLMNYHLFSQSFSVFEELSLEYKIASIAGLERTLYGSKDQLKLRGSRNIMGRVEDGLLPVNFETQKLVLNIAYESVPSEIYLMLVLGFYTGMRLSTICDLKLLTLKHARASEDGGFYYLSVGPSVSYAPVATKFGVSGEVPIPVYVYDMVRSYIKSSRRVQRLSKATLADQQLVFLNKNGKTYCRKGRGSSSTVNNHMLDIRKAARSQGYELSFKFHQTRATFGTDFVLSNLDKPGVSLKSVIGTLKDVMLHKSEKATMTYIRFVQSNKAKAKWADEFFRRSVELRQKW
ncbi:site-specific integrase [Pseudomonas putida]|uniref:site-specific integrase n=1 Tax=Pseudomonas putida TaxID=303 RepID=UPI0023635D87|nr:site-specific integrase [Pseudomonas putida]MDD2068513.1 site-specific integrase [Pseudomonas putida]HDS1739690.1 site-specific integrase [Pseudomonas putida]